MSVTPVVLWGPSALGNSAAALFTASGVGSRTTVTRAVFTNTDTATQTITVNVVRSGGSVQTSNQVISAFPISPGQTYCAPELAGLVLNAGDAVEALCSTAAKVNAMASGYAQ